MCKRGERGERESEREREKERQERFASEALSLRSPKWEGEDGENGQERYAGNAFCSLSNLCAFYFHATSACATK